MHCLRSILVDEWPLVDPVRLMRISRAGQWAAGNGLENLPRALEGLPAGRPAEGRSGDSRGAGAYGK